MLLFGIGVIVGGVLVAVVLNNINSTKVKALEAQITSQAKTAVTNAAASVAAKI